MKEIVLEAKTEGVLMFNIADIEAHCERLEDKRGTRGKIYPLPMLVVLLILAKLSGEDKPTGITAWVRERKEQLWRLFDWPHERMPCLNTFRTIMSDVLDADALEALFLDYLHQTYGGMTSRLVTIDGKTMRGTIPKGLTRGVHLLAVYLPEEGVTLKQVLVDKKENEISAAAGLLEDIPLKGRVVCADAMQTQRDLSSDVVGKGGNYIWFVKGNQPSLLADVEQFFKPPRRSAGWHILSLPQTTASEISSGHGRIETRTLTLIVDDQNFLNWPALSQVFMLRREVIFSKTGKTTVEIAYGITSCSPTEADATQLLQLTRRYWGIENGLHYRRDVTLNEDATRISNRNMAAVMATLNNFLIGLTQKMGYFNLADARRVFDFQIDRQLLC